MLLSAGLAFICVWAAGFPGPWSSGPQKNAEAPGADIFEPAASAS